MLSFALYLKHIRNRAASLKHFRNRVAFLNQFLSILKAFWNRSCIFEAFWRRFWRESVAKSYNLRVNPFLCCGPIYIMTKICQKLWFKSWFNNIQLFHFPSLHRNPIFLITKTKYIWFLIIRFAVGMSVETFKSKKSCSK